MFFVRFSPGLAIGREEASCCPALARELLRTFTGAQNTVLQFPAVQKARCQEGGQRNL